MSQWEARIAENWELMGVSIVWAQEGSDGTRVVSNGSTSWVIAPDHGTSTNVEPLRLRDDHARALLAALLRYYNGADDARMLRKDYDAERARVDKLIEYATSSVRQR